MTPKGGRGMRSSAGDMSQYAGLLKPGRRKKKLLPKKNQGTPGRRPVPRGMDTAIGGGTASRAVSNAKPAVRKPAVNKVKPAATMPLPAPTPRPNPGAKLMPGEMMQPRAGRVGPIMRPRPIPKRAR